MLLSLATQAVAQSPAQLVALGRSRQDRDPRGALALFERALAIDSLDFEANWRAVLALVTIGQETPDSVESAGRDSLYFRAERLARRAVESDSTRAEGQFAVAMALGRVALTKSRRDRIRYAAAIYRAVARTLDIDPRHDGAHHLLGLWNAEVMRTSGFDRFMARNLLGGRILGKASWAQAIEQLETAVRLDPGRIYHRLDLARVYVDRKRYGAARAQLDTIATLPDRMALDPRYRQDAARLETRIAGLKDPQRAGALPVGPAPGR